MGHRNWHALALGDRCSFGCTENSARLSQQNAHDRDMINQTRIARMSPNRTRAPISPDAVKSLASTVSAVWGFGSSPPDIGRINQGRPPLASASVAHHTVSSRTNKEGINDKSTRAGIAGVNKISHIKSHFEINMYSKTKIGQKGDCAVAPYSSNLCHVT